MAYSLQQLQLPLATFSYLQLPLATFSYLQLPFLIISASVFTGIKDCSADVLRPVVPLAVIIFLVATGIVGTVCVVYVILKCRKSSGCTEVTSSDEESSRSRPHTLTMIGV